MYYKRSAWTNKPNNSVAFKGAQTSTTFHYPGFGNPTLKTANWSLQKCFNQIRTWEGQHQARGSKNIEYNFFVLPTGDVVEGRGFRQSGANGTSAANRYSISVQILIGDNEPLNSKFLKGIAEALKLIKQHQPKALNKFYPHKHWVGTRCPGPAVEAALKNGTINKNMTGSVSVPSAGTSAPKPTPKPSTTSAGIYEVTATVLNYRQGAGTKYKVSGTIKKGEKYTITEIKNGWGKLKSGAGWVAMKYMKPVKAAPKPVNKPSAKPSSTSAGVYEVTATVLNYRKGAGTGYKINGTIKKGEKYTITEIKNGWGKLKSGAGWVAMKYMKPVK